MDKVYTVAGRKLQRAIIRVRVDADLCHNIALLGNDELGNRHNVRGDIT